MNTEEMVNIASIIYMNYVKEELKENKKPRLIYNIAFTKYNEALNFDPLSMESFIITSLINDYILISYYQNTVKYSRPVTDYVEDKDSYVLFGNENEGYIVEDHRIDDIKVRKLD